MPQSIVSSVSLSIDSAPVSVNGAPITPLLAGLIIIASTLNAGSGAVSTAKAAGLIGVTKEGTDAKGYAAVATQHGTVVDVIAGAAVTAGNQITSNATGQGVPVVPANAGAVTQIAGVALTSQATVGQTFKMLLAPCLGLS